MQLKPNLLIHSNALDVLERISDQSIDLVYLDPPWLTDKSVSDNERDEYINFIYRIFQQCRRALNSSGNFFLYSRPDLNPDFTHLLMQVFGVRSFVNEFIIPSKRQAQTRFWSSHDSLLCYSKTEHHTYNKVYSVDENDIQKLFPYKDKKGRFTYLSLFGRNNDGAGNFEWKGTYPPTNYKWRFSKETLDDMDLQGLIVLEDGRLHQKKYLTSEDQLLPIGTIWNDISPIRRSTYASEQSVKLLDRILRLGSNSKEIVLDVFCGSGASVEACINSGRQFIGCDNNSTAIETTQRRILNSSSTVNYTFLQQDELELFPVISNNYKRVLPQVEDDLYQMILKGESESVEFKVSACWNIYTKLEDQSLIKPILETFVSFLNSAGGTILIGVGDDGVLWDLKQEFHLADKGKKSQDGYELHLNNRIRDKLGSAIIGKYTLGMYSINECTICKIDIKQSSSPIFLDGNFFVRNNNQSIKLSAQETYYYLKDKESM
jgi:DNA modification methylase